MRLAIFSISSISDDESLSVAPSFLKEYKPDLLVIMNPIYKNEIAKDLNSLGLNPEIKTSFKKNDFVYIGDVANALRSLVDQKAKEGI